MTMPHETLAQPSPAPIPGAMPAQTEVVESQYDDYFGFGGQEAYTLPDGKQQIFFTVMNEGQRVRYEKSVNRDIHLNRQTQDARISQDAAGERHAIILAAVTGWSLKMRDPASGQWVDAPYDNNTPGGKLNQWLQRANPKIVEELADAIREKNPWTRGDMSVEDVDKELERLSDLRKQLVEEEEKKAAFQK